MTLPRVATIVLNWNGCADTLACLASLQHLDYPDCGGIVVDHGSTDNAVARRSLDYREERVTALEGHGRAGPLPIGK